MAKVDIYMNKWAYGDVIFFDIYFVVLTSGLRSDDS